MVKSDAGILSKEHKALAAISVGNALAYFDLIIFSVMAVQISQAIFPKGDPLVALMQTFSLMGVGYLARPVGAFVLGRIADRSGRRKALLLAFSLSGIAVVGQALVPSYASAGVLAPVTMLIFRLLMGFAMGGEFGSAAAMLIETAPPARRASFLAVQLTGQDIGTVSAGLVAMLLATLLTPAALIEWGWRAAMLAGGSIIPLGLYLRSRIPETLVHAKPGSEDELPTPIGLGKAQFLSVLLLLAAIFVADGIKYLGIYAQTVLSLEPRIAFSATVSISLASIVFTLAGARLSDHIGRRALILSAMAMVTLAVLPAFWWLNQRPTLGTLIFVSGLLASTLAFGSAAIITTIAEMMPARRRATTLALVAAIGVALIAGTADLFYTWLIHATGAPMSPAFAMSLVGLCGIGVAVALPESGPAKAAGSGLNRAGIATA